MNHEDFPVKGFEFMNEPATDGQKRIILDLMARLNIQTSPDCLSDPKSWPDPFNRWDAKCMIDALKEKLGESTLDGSCDCPPCHERHEKTRSELCDCPHCQRNRDSEDIPPTKRNP